MLFGFFSCLFCVVGLGLRLIEGVGMGHNEGSISYRGQLMDNPYKSPEEFRSSITADQESIRFPSLGIISFGCPVLASLLLELFIALEPIHVDSSSHIFATISAGTIVLLCLVGFITGVIGLRLNRNKLLCKLSIVLSSGMALYLLILPAF